MNQYIIADLYQYQGIKLYDDLDELVGNLYYIFDFMEFPFLDQNGLKRYILDEIRRFSVANFLNSGIDNNYIKIWNTYISIIPNSLIPKFFDFNPEVEPVIHMDKIPMMNVLENLMYELGQFSSIYDTFYSDFSNNGLYTHEFKLHILFQIFHRYVYKWAPNKPKEKPIWMRLPMVTKKTFPHLDPLFDPNKEELWD